MEIMIISGMYTVNVIYFSLNNFYGNPPKNTIGLTYCYNFSHSLKLYRNYNSNKPIVFFFEISTYCVVLGNYVFLKKANYCSFTFLVDISFRGLTKNEMFVDCLCCCSDTC